MFDPNKNAEDISINSQEDYMKATESLHNNVFDSYSDEGKKMKKIIEEINNFHQNQNSQIKKW